MGRWIGAFCLLIIAFYLLRGGTFTGLLELVLKMLEALAQVGRDLAPKVVHKP